MMIRDSSTGNIIHHGSLSDYEKKGLVWNIIDDNGLSQLLQLESKGDNKNIHNFVPLEISRAPTLYGNNIIYVYII